MRRFLIPLMAASMLVPAAAVARDGDRARGDRQQSERSERTRADSRPERAERKTQTERAERRTQPERAERPVRAERTVRTERQPRIERSRDVQRVERVQPARRVERGDGLVGRIQDRQVERRARNATEDRREPSGFDGLHERIVENGSRVSHDRDGDRDWRRDGGRHEWSRDWRRDHRYDWWKYRDRYRSLFRLGHYYDPYGWGYRRFSIGFSLWPSYYGSSFWLNDPWQYRLPPAYGPYRWVRYYDDALLVNIYTGEVVDVVYNVFW